MKYFRVALLQMTAGASQAENLEKGLAWCRRAKAMGADLSLFPEMWNCGYAVERPDLEALAIRRDDPFLLAFRDLAAELEMAIAVTYLERRADLRQGPHLRLWRREKAGAGGEFPRGPAGYRRRPGPGGGHDLL